MCGGEGEGAWGAGGGLSVKEKEANEIPQEGGSVFRALRPPAWHLP